MERKTKREFPSEIIVGKEGMDEPLITILAEILHKSFRAGAVSISLIPKDKEYLVTCSDGNRHIPIRVIGCEMRSRFVFPMISRVKILTGMMITIHTLIQYGSCSKIGPRKDLSFTAMVVPTELGEALFITFSR